MASTVGEARPISRPDVDSETEGPVSESVLPSNMKLARDPLPASMIVATPFQQDRQPGVYCQVLAWRFSRRTLLERCAEELRRHGRNGSAGLSGTDQKQKRMATTEELDYLLRKITHFTHFRRVANFRVLNARAHPGHRYGRRHISENVSSSLIILLFRPQHPRCLLSFDEP